MLTKISSDKFRVREIGFRRGLNVVLGDNFGANSIGKSTLLMLVDFAHGGDDLLEKTPEVHENLGPHYYIFHFRFAATEYVFKRETAARHSVQVLGDNLNVLEKWSIGEFRQWLKERYDIAAQDLSFRQCVSPFSRIWRRTTLDLDHPFNSYPKQATKDVLDTLLKIFDSFAALAELHQELKVAKEEKTSLTKAQKTGLLPQIGRKEYSANVRAIETLTAELNAMRDRLELYATNISELVNKELLEAQGIKERLLSEQLTLQTRLARITRQLDSDLQQRSAAFEPLLELFPTVNLERLEQVEEFHRGLTRIVRRELGEVKARLRTQLDAIEEQLEGADHLLGDLLSGVHTPREIVDRVVHVSWDMKERERANVTYDKKVELATEQKELEKSLSEQRLSKLTKIAEDLNAEISRSFARVYPKGPQPARLDLTAAAYGYRVYDDTGTGTAYAAVMLLDLAMLRCSSLPYTVHDSLFWKNVEVSAVQGLVQEFEAITDKQTFIALDEIVKYGHETVTTLERRSIITLSKEHLLYDKDWRTK